MPQPVSLVAPGAGAINVSTLPTLTWNRAPWAVAFDLYLGTNPSGMTPIGACRRGAQRNPATDLLLHAQPGAPAGNDLLLEGRLAHVCDRRRSDAYRHDERDLVHDRIRFRRRWFLRAITRNAGSAAGNDSSSKTSTRAGAPSPTATPAAATPAVRTATPTSMSKPRAIMAAAMTSDGSSPGEWLKYTVNVTTAGTYNIAGTRRVLGRRTGRSISKSTASTRPGR